MEPTARLLTHQPAMAATPGPYAQRPGRDQGYRQGYGQGQHPGYAADPGQRPGNGQGHDGYGRP